MSGPAAVNIPPVVPGQPIDISVNLVAPGTPGDYTGYWQLKSSNGETFLPLSIVITVPAPPAAGQPPAPPQGPQPPRPPAADKTPPDIKDISFSSTEVAYGASCAKPTQLTVTASVSDPSGVKSVTLHYSYNKTILTTSIPMNFFGIYFAVVNVGDEANRYLGGKNGSLFVWVHAEDALGNVGPWVPGGSVAVNFVPEDNCIK